RHVLPPKEEPHEVPGGDGLDLPSETRLRVVVDTGQEAPGAEFLGTFGIDEVAAKREAVALQAGQSDGHVTSGKPRRFPEVADRRWPPVFKVSPHHLRDRR